MVILPVKVALFLILLSVVHTYGPIKRDPTANGRPTFGQMGAFHKIQLPDKTVPSYSKSSHAYGKGASPWKGHLTRSSESKEKYQSSLKSNGHHPFGQMGAFHKPLLPGKSNPLQLKSSNTYNKEASTHWKGRFGSRSESKEKSTNSKSSLKSNVRPPFNPIGAFQPYKPGPSNIQSSHAYGKEASHWKGHFGKGSGSSKKSSSSRSSSNFKISKNYESKISKDKNIPKVINSLDSLSKKSYLNKKIHLSSKQSKLDEMFQSGSSSNDDRSHSKHSGRSSEPKEKPSTSKSSITNQFQTNKNAGSKSSSNKNKQKGMDSLDSISNISDLNKYFHRSSKESGSNKLFQSGSSFKNDRSASKSSKPFSMQNKSHYKDKSIDSKQSASSDSSSRSGFKGFYLNDNKSRRMQGSSKLDNNKSDKDEKVSKSSESKAYENEKLTKETMQSDKGKPFKWPPINKPNILVNHTKPVWPMPSVNKQEKPILPLAKDLPKAPWPFTNNAKLPPWSNSKNSEQHSQQALNKSKVFSIHQILQNMFKPKDKDENVMHQSTVTEDKESSSLKNDGQTKSPATVNKVLSRVKTISSKSKSMKESRTLHQERSPPKSIEIKSKSQKLETPHESKSKEGEMTSETNRKTYKEIHSKSIENSKQLQENSPNEINIKSVNKKSSQERNNEKSPTSNKFRPEASITSQPEETKVKNLEDQGGKDEEKEEMPRFGPSMKPPYKKSKKCETPTPPCCVPGQLQINLNNVKGKKAQIGKLGGVSVLGICKAQGKNKRQACSNNVAIMVEFEKIDSNVCFGCLEAPYCGRRMLKVELKLSNSRRGGWLFNVGDSVSNNGYGGDDGDQQNDAETQALFPNITVYPSDKCPTINSFMHIINAVADSVDTVTLYISNEHIRITNSEGLDFKLCHKCLYALNGQKDDGPDGKVNEAVYIGLNRVIKSVTRSGFGVCSATLSWMCPWCMGNS